MNLLARQQPAGANSSGAAKPKGPMGPGGLPLAVWLAKLHSRRAMYVLWWTLAGVAGVLVLLRVARCVRARRIRRRVAPFRATRATTSAIPTFPSSSTLASATASTTIPGAAEKGGRGACRVRAVVRAACAAWNNTTHVRVPLTLFPGHTVNEWFWTAAYVGLVLGLTMWGSMYEGKLNYSRVFGLASISQLPFIVSLAGRNNLLSFLTGLSYERLNWLHRAAGRTCVLTAWAHMGAMVAGGVRISPTSVTGALALTALSVSFLVSFVPLRRAAYEVFILVHNAMGIVLLAALCVHRSMYAPWAWSGFVIWGADRVLSLCKMAWASHRRGRATVELLGSDAVRVTVSTRMRWRAGQHAYITLPSVGPTEQHPFTMASAGGTEAVFLIRAHRGFTRRLLAHPGLQRCLLDGPYGIPPRLDHFGAVTLVAGGTGVSFCLALLLGVIRDAREGRSAVASVHLVWNTRDEDPVAWIRPLVEEAVAAGRGGLEVRIDVHRTRGRDVEALAAESDTASEHNEKMETASLLHVREGRADVERVIRRDVGACPDDAGGLAVVVCGPEALSLETRRAVCRVNTPGAVAKGQPPIDFFSEQFGW